LADDKAIHLGHPSYVWAFGQERRLELIRRFAPFEGQTILDVGCGLGTYVRAFRRFSHKVHGVDLDAEKVVEAGRDLPHMAQASAEELPFADGTFDLVLSHEVIEHVGDDRQAIAEAVRVLRRPSAAGTGGRLVIFAPNRLYPFETHGAYWRGRYHFGNVPLVNYLPERWRKRFAPHVRAYTRRDLRRLLAGLPVRTVVHTEIFPGYDKIVRRHRRLGALLRRLTYFLEHTPLRILGLSHLVVVEKTQ
jgi:SAM-dependent methyltransferase